MPPKKSTAKTPAKRTPAKAAPVADVPRVIEVDPALVHAEVTHIRTVVKRYSVMSPMTVNTLNTILTPDTCNTLTGIKATLHTTDQWQSDPNIVDVKDEVSISYTVANPGGPIEHGEIGG